MAEHSNRQAGAGSPGPIAVDPLAHQAGQLYVRGVQHHQAGRISEAEALYTQVLAIDPSHVGTLVNLGAIRSRRGDRIGAIEAYRQALRINPNHAAATNNLGDALLGLGELAKAEECFRSAVALDRKYVDAQYNLGVVLSFTERLEDAAQALEHTIELQPDHARAHNNLGAVRQHQGQFEAAAAAYLRAIAIKPLYGAPYYQLASMAAMKDGPVSVDMLSELFRQVANALDDFEPESRSRILFAMGKTFERLGEYDRAFEAFAQANAIARASRPFDMAAEERRLATIADVFDSATVRRLEGEGLIEDRPIFIVGMPRSGTTLVEQIISAHPQVRGAGELANLENLINRTGDIEGSAFPAWAAHFTGARWRAFGQAYLDSLPAPQDGETRLTDKWLNNYEFVGLIHACLPNARIICCRRDPRDIAVSCFSMIFGENRQAYSYDLADIGRYWRAYDRLIQHWLSVLPPGRMLDVQYEDVVADIEGWARKLIAYCGLEWDDGCLRFYESERAVRTASFAQVRQPIYTDSVGRWRRFERHLGPLLEALGKPYK